MPNPFFYLNRPVATTTPSSGIFTSYRVPNSRVFPPDSLTQVTQQFADLTATYTHRDGEPMGCTVVKGNYGSSLQSLCRTEKLYAISESNDHPLRIYVSPHVIKAILFWAEGLGYRREY